MNSSYSVVVPAYNAAATVEEALHSILAQTVLPEVIVLVDDGSTDDTGLRAAQLDSRISVIQQTNQGCGGATTTGIAAVTTPFVAFLDADDLWLPNKAERQLVRFSENSGVAALVAQAQIFKGPTYSPQLGPVSDVWGRTTLMIRTEAARNIGEVIDPPGARGDMVDWIARGRELGHAFELMNEVLAMRRIRPGSLSYGRDAEKDRGYLLTVKRALERKRAAAAQQATPAERDE
ncbi:glycosyltransferase family A protein [Parvibaculum sp.]|uniref:glycosyltransferase family A protein n=1 Tax=Parvibaculum sp. TaxID=2024848 RepID=UPI00320F6B48